MKTVYKTGDVDKIVNEVASELKGCTFVVFGADHARFDEITKKFHKCLPDAKKIGGTGFMFTKDGSMDAGMTAIGFTDDEVEVYVGTMRKISEYPIKYLPGLLWSANEISKKYKDSICLEFTTGSEEKIVSTMKVALEGCNVRLIGGTSGNSNGEPHKIAANGKVMTDCTVYAVIGSKMGSIDIYKENLFRARKQAHIVTKVSEDSRTILEIDNRKAVDVYKEELGYTGGNLEDGIYNHPLCKVVGDDNYLTAIFSFNKDGSITTYKNMQKNDQICFTDLEEDFRGYIENNMKNIAAKSKVAGIISINCILRYLYFEENHFTKEYAKIMDRAANGNHLGIVSDGEQYAEQHVNQSMVCVVFNKDR